MSKTLSIDGMGCDGCEDIVESALGDVSGVSDVEADHESGEATVEGDEDEDELVRSVELAGYSVESTNA